MPKVHVTETVLRDGHQSLIATRMRTEHMLPICPQLDRVGFWSLEVWGGATFDASIRFLKEDPWERLRSLRKALPNTPLQMLLRGQNLLGYRHYSNDLVDAFVQRAADNGVDIFRVFDALNDTRNLRRSIEAVRRAGRHAQGALCYTVSPVHGIPRFAELARELESMGCDSIAIKDMAGLLTPSATAELVASLTAAVKVPIHLHTHATTGMASMCHLKAVESGCLHLDTAISAFAGGTSHPPTESLVAALQGTPFDTGLDLPLLQEIGFYFHEVRKRYRQFESEFTGVDTRVQVNQVPGGMVSNLANQLREQGALNRMQEVLEEIPRVREDLGYPPLVTPTSQIVGTQAVLNVLTGSRYQSVTNEVKSYLLGRYGRAPGPINSLVLQQATGNEEATEVSPADLIPPELDRLREEIGDLANTEEELLTFAMFPEVGRAFLQQRAEGSLKPEPLEPVGEGERGGIPTEFKVTLHGETHHIYVTGAGHKGAHKRPFYVTVDGVPEEIDVEVLNELTTEAKEKRTPLASPKRPKAIAPGHVTTAMPGTIVEITARLGDVVEAGAPLLVVEAMKMESEIRAPIGGKITAIHVAKGDSVSANEALVEIE